MDQHSQACRRKLRFCWKNMNWRSTEQRPKCINRGQSTKILIECWLLASVDIWPYVAVVQDSLISYLKVGDLHNSPTVNNNGTSPVLTGSCWLQYEVQRRIFTTYIWSTMIWPASEMVLQHFHRFHFIFCCILDANIYQLHIVCTSIKKI